MLFFWFLTILLVFAHSLNEHSCPGSYAGGVMQLVSKQGFRGIGTPLGGANALAILPLYLSPVKPYKQLDG